MCKCLYCYKPLNVGEKDFHLSCAKKFFGTNSVPKLDYTLEQIDALASQIIEEQTSLTGVQAKLSLHLNKHKDRHRLTIVGLWGSFIMKPQTEIYPQLPEIEDLTMHLAQIAKISVVPHSLMRMADGSLCYITKRIDRTKNGEKIAMEDFCQLTERQTEYKYRSSYETIGKAILKYSSMPKMDLTNFMDILLFSWIVGNNDMHLKNFSLYEAIENFPRLSPAYDLINAVIVNPKDKEELALSLNGKKAKLKAEDFINMATNLGLTTNLLPRLLAKYTKLEAQFSECIKSSFLSEDLKDLYIALISKRLNRLQE